MTPGGTPTAQGLEVSTIWGDLLWVDGGWPGSCHEHELMKLAGLEGALDDVEVASLLDRGFRGMAKDREHWRAGRGPAHQGPAHRRAAGRAAPESERRLPLV